MPKSPTGLPSGIRVTDTITATLFAKVFPVTAVNEILERHGCGTIRERHLPNEYVVYFILMMALFRDSALREVFRIVAESFNRLRKKAGEPHIPTASALSQACSRISSDAFAEMFHRFCVPVSTGAVKGCFFKRWRKVAMDGSVIDVCDTEENRDYFGTSKNQHQTQARFPKLRLCMLMEVGTHLTFSASMGPYSKGEIGLAQDLIPYIKPDMICIFDRNFFSFDMYSRIAERGAAALFRLQKGLILRSDQILQDGSHLVTIYHHKDVARKNGVTARFFQYRVHGAKNKEMYFMLTNILDPNEASATELAALYCERWEIENTLDELKSHLNTENLLPRSKTPNRVKQEIWALLMTHYVLRLNMFQAALIEDFDPDRISFVHTIRVVQRTLAKSSFFSPEEASSEDTQGDS